MFVLDPLGGRITALTFAPDSSALYTSYGCSTYAWNLVDRTSRLLRFTKLLVSSLITLHPSGRGGKRRGRPEPSREP